MAYKETYWAKEGSYIVSMSLLDNRITFILMNLSSEDATEIFNIVLENITRLKTKFTSITDLSTFKPLDSNVPNVIAEIQALLAKYDWGCYARVKQTDEKDLSLHGVMKDGFFNSFQSAEFYLNEWRKAYSDEEYRDRLIFKEIKKNNDC